MRKAKLLLIVAAGFAGTPSSAEAPAPPSPSTAAMTPDAKAYLDRAISLFRENHIDASKMDWPALTQKAYAAAVGAKTTADTYPAIRLIIKELGEKHTLFIDPDHARAINTGKGSGNAVPPPLMLPEAMLLAHRIGVVRLYRMQGPPEWATQYSTAGKAKVSALKRRGACKFVLDLRDDWGGNMYPMIDAVSDLLGDGLLGTFVNASGENSPWFLLHGKSSTRGAKDRGSAGLKAAPVSIPVAVLIGPQTSSAAEFTAISFEGRPNSRFFGAPSGGYITANRPIDLSDGAIIAMTVGWGTDRIGRKYVDRIEPDEVTGAGGPAFDAAVKWLAAQPCRGGVKRRTARRR
jgi:carboxyl-terminal processing protease